MELEDKINLYEDLRALINKYGLEGPSNTPDTLLTDYLLNCLYNYNSVILDRARWYGRIDVPGQGSVPYPWNKDELKEINFDKRSQDS